MSLLMAQEHLYKRPTCQIKADMHMNKVLTYFIIVLHYLATCGYWVLTIKCGWCDWETQFLTWFKLKFETV